MLGPGMWLKGPYSLLRCCHFRLSCRHPSMIAWPNLSLLCGDRFDHCCLGYLRILIPFAPAQQASARFWPEASPLLEKESDIGGAALISYLNSPFFRHRPRVWPAFATDNRPIESAQI